MLRTPSILPRFAVKWVSQVAASVGATLVATAIYAALPKPAAPEAAPPALTSGGKYAARAVVLEAEDGLDRMPLPRSDPSVAPPPEGAPLRRVVWEGAAPLVTRPDPVPRPPRIGDPAARPSAHVEIRRAVPARRLAAAAPASPVAQPVVVREVAQASEDQGSLIQAVPRALPRILPRILPTALSGIEAAWSLTAEAGGALVARVVPRIP